MLSLFPWRLSVSPGFESEATGMSDAELQVAVRKPFVWHLILI
ncbi:MAG: hypothetical protein QNL80_12080 [Akkermansiaceae bacterium]